MPRWEANARERLARAALELFEERGYESTTVIEIAERAGLTKSTFFRHFADKREVLFGEDVMSALLVGAIASAPAEATARQAVEAALDAAGSEVFTAERRAFVVRRSAVIAATPELQEREALKGLVLTASMAAALQRRGAPAMTARAVAELGALASAVAYERWVQAGPDQTFGELARRALAEVYSALDG